MSEPRIAMASITEVLDEEPVMAIKTGASSTFIFRSKWLPNSLISASSASLFQLDTPSSRQTRNCSSLTRSSRSRLIPSKLASLMAGSPEKKCPARGATSDKVSTRVRTWGRICAT